MRLPVGAILVTKYNNSSPVMNMVFLGREGYFYTFYAGVEIYSHYWHLIFTSWKWSKWNISRGILESSFTESIEKANLDVSS